VFSSSEVLVLSTGVTVDEQMKASDHFVQISRVDGFKGNTHNGPTVKVCDACQVDCSLQLTAEGPGFENTTVFKPADAEDHASRNGVQSL